MLTEDEARGKACHRTLCANIWSNPKENEGECNTATTPCIASACMAWRWVEGGGPGPQHPDGPERDMRGYCGLAGKDGA